MDLNQWFPVLHADHSRSLGNISAPVLEKMEWLDILSPTIPSSNLIFPRVLVDSDLEMGCTPRPNF